MIYKLVVNLTFSLLIFFSISLSSEILNENSAENTDIKNVDISEETIDEEQIILVESVKLIDENNESDTDNEKNNGVKQKYSFIRDLLLTAGLIDSNNKNDNSSLNQIVSELNESPIVLYAEEISSNSSNIKSNDEQIAANARAITSNDTD
ncbi:hypothetical protein N9B16_01720, partial [Gammaproteobacteria bacterium]|nr:hypothetical protein [Gammaproteobacteria bacterium]